MEIVVNKKAEHFYQALSPLQMKIFSGNDYLETETQINDWLGNHPIRIEHICQSQCERNGKLLFLVSVFFKLMND